MDIVQEGKKYDDMSNKDQFNLEGRVLGIIHIHLSDEIYYSILLIKPLSSLWRKLESMYMTKSLTSKTYLKRQLYYFRMSDFDSLQFHLHKLLSEFGI